jgi:alkylation response protein AidB-like acyl-CoA dehydrogenase
MLADMLTRTEVARAAVYSAGTALDESPSGSAKHRLVYGAKVIAGDAAIANGKAATQVFGGMGFTWEVDVHLYLKRAWVLETHFEDADRNAELVAAIAGDPRIFGDL